MGAIQHVWVRSRGVNLSVEVSIPTDRPDAPTVVLVHGYPDNAEVWKEVREHLAKDFVVVAYDCRGAGQSSAPSTTRGYALGRFEDDLVAVTDLVSPDHPFHLVGHDWGSIHSWESVTEERLKGRIASFTSISGPCLDHLALWLRSKLSKPKPRNLWLVTRQLLASLYVFFFQLPLLPELTWRLGWKKVWPKWFKWVEGVPMTSGPRQLADGINGLGMYRANVLKILFKPRMRVAHAPVQIIVPTKDIYVRPFLAEAAVPFVPVLWRRDVADTHWVIRKRPELIASYVREFIQWVDADRAPNLPLRMHGGRR